jgi:hypothetical protein
VKFILGVSALKYPNEFNFWTYDLLRSVNYIRNICRCGVYITKNKSNVIDESKGKVAPVLD